MLWEHQDLMIIYLLHEVLPCIGIGSMILNFLTKCYVSQVLRIVCRLISSFFIYHRNGCTGSYFCNYSWWTCTPMRWLAGNMHKEEINKNNHPWALWDQAYIYSEKCTELVCSKHPFYFWQNFFMNIFKCLSDELLLFENYLCGLLKIRLWTMHLS